MLNNIIAFKVHIQKSLEDYENFVMEEVEQELGAEGDSHMSVKLGADDVGVMR